MLSLTLTTQCRKLWSLGKGLVSISMMSSPETDMKGKLLTKTYKMVSIGYPSLMLWQPSAIVHLTSKFYSFCMMVIY